MFGDQLPEANRGDIISAQEHWEALRSLLARHQPGLFSHLTELGGANAPPPINTYDLFGRLDGSLSKAGSATVTQYDWTGSAWSLGSFTETVIGSPLLKTNSLNSGTEVEYRYFPAYGIWCVVNADCDS